MHWEHQMNIFSDKQRHKTAPAVKSVSQQSYGTKMSKKSRTHRQHRRQAPWR